MPGIQPMPSIEYKNQDIPSPRRAWVHRDATDEAIVFSNDRKFVSPCSSDGEVISTERMQRLHQLARRIVDFGTYSRHLSHHKLNNDKTETTESEPMTNIEMEFVAAMLLLSQQIDEANKFKADLVAHLNKNHKQTDRLFTFPLSPNCETSHEGMMKVFADIGESLRFFDIEEGESEDLGRATSLPTAKKRKVHLCVDQLSAKMFRHLKMNLTKKLTELSSGKFVEPLLEALDQFTVQHDYLHEHRMHRQDVIWRQFYGSVLQAFQAEIRYLRVNGDCVKNNLQSHERMLIIVNRALKNHRFARFLECCGEGFFVLQEDEDVVEMLLRINEAFTEYCNMWEKSDDLPSRLCNNLLKMLEAYFKCVHSVKKQNSWMCEAENVIWLGAYKLAKKQNYLHEASETPKIWYGQ
jgi:hypothetical protein